MKFPCNCIALMVYECHCFSLAFVFRGNMTGYQLILQIYHTILNQIEFVQKKRSYFVCGQ